MEYFAAIDVSLELSSVCVVDGAGQIVREAKVASEPDALIQWFRETGLTFTRIGLEAGPLSQWLHAGLVAAGFPVILIETRHVKAALSAMIVKTDRNDARGMAQLISGHSKIIVLYQVCPGMAATRGHVPAPGGFSINGAGLGQLTAG